MTSYGPNRTEKHPATGSGCSPEFQNSNVIVGLALTQLKATAFISTCGQDEDACTALTENLDQAEGNRIRHAFDLLRFEAQWKAVLTTCHSRDTSLDTFAERSLVPVLNGTTKLYSRLW
ncbi:set and mynd domain-containing [Moniliophthora roreri]|nr:set and mynd domain-containing [Moniliophthora roreri]